jgi:hypothetical protein
MKGIFRVAAAGIATLTTSTVFAEDYSFEVGSGYDRNQYDSFSQFLDNPSLGQGSAEFLSSRDTDSLNLVGTWYFAGLSDEKGPRTRAPLFDRTSALNLFYRRADVSSFLSISSTIPSITPGERRTDASTEEVGASVRLTSRESGWFMQGGFLNTEVDLPFSPQSNDSTWNIGVGRYIFESTTLSLDVGERDIGFFNSETIGLGVEHVASLVGSWQYGVDLSYERLDGDVYDFNDWRLALALYPSRDLGFGVSYAEQPRRLAGTLSVSRDEVESLDGFVSWFVTPNLELGARYRVDDVGTANEDGFGLSLNIRF